MYTAQGKRSGLEASQLVQTYAPLVRRLALQLVAKLPASVEVDDLVQVGMMGLLEAGERYQDLQQAKFETYATQRIRGAMLDELRAGDWVSRGMRQSAKRVSQAIRVQEQRRGRVPTEAEIAGELDMPLPEYQRLLGEIHGCQLVHFDGIEADPGKEGFLDQHAAGDCAQRGDTRSPMDLLMRKDLRRELLQALQALPERDQVLLGLYYEEELNLREIGAVLDLSQARVCQLHAQALARLRAGLAG